MSSIGLIALATVNMHGTILVSFRSTPCINSIARMDDHPALEKWVGFRFENEIKILGIVLSALEVWYISKEMDKVWSRK